ncbi:MAG TPA: VOC family protein [Opitutaceae bacterium]|jgi:predicted enzyme related to lactoylglutathione lyase|nr:VOC family protein [Opitutaceae bacterium]
MKTLRLFLLLFLAVIGARADDLPPINATPTSLTLPGKMIWADLYTQTPDSEVQFYTGLFGWTAETIKRPNGNKYTVLSNNGQPVAGVVFRTAPHGDTGHGRWINYVAVTDVAQTITVVTGLGGKVVHPPKYLPQRGTQAILTDSQGSLLGVIQSSSGDPDDTQPNVGNWAWAHLSARDPAAASQFYHAVLGYEVAPDPREGRPDVFLLNSQGFARASIGPIPNRPEAYPDWLGFIRVANLDEALAKATALGASVLLTPKSTEQGTRIAILADPADVAIGLVELTNPTAQEAQKP